MPRTPMNARSNVPSTTHADAIRDLAGLPTILNHASEALGFEGEEKGALYLIDRVMKRLGQIRDEIVVPSVVFVPPKPRPEYRAEGLPSGFDTITGFIARENPEMIEFMDDLVGDTLADHAELRLATRQHGQAPTKIKPSPAVVASGRSEDWAYPVGLLSRKYLGGM